jgi:transposase
MTKIMRPDMNLTQVYLYSQPIDFRKSFRGISAIVECELGHNPFKGHLYAFTNKQRNKIKCLFWENNSFVLYYKSLEDDKFILPKASDSLVTLNGQQINWLLDGLDLNIMKGHKKLHYESFFKALYRYIWYTLPHKKTPKSLKKKKNPLLVAWKKCSYCYLKKITFLK